MCDQVFGWGKYGGYGKIIEVLGKHLTKRGIKCSVITWRGYRQKMIEQWHNMFVLSFPYSGSFTPLNVLSYSRSFPLYKMVDADIYYSIDARIETYLAMKAMPDRKHIINFQDPYDEKDFQQMSSVDSLYQWNFVTRLKLFATYGFLHKACENANGLYTHARYLIPKIKRLFRLNKPIDFLPNPVEIPKRKMKKAGIPTVCFVGRWDPQKRIELFLKLVFSFPKVNFILLGKGRNEMENKRIKEKYSKLENLEILGFVSEQKKSEVLERSWIMVNTSIREALPITFLEALAHKTAILSYVNPDSFASNFGIHVANCDFKTALNKLLENDLWEQQGKKGYAYVRKFHEAEKVVDRCIQLIKRLR